MIGQCLGETRLINIPPRFAFDDPDLFGDRTPVPRATTVNNVHKCILYTQTIPTPPSSTLF